MSNKTKIIIGVVLAVVVAVGSVTFYNSFLREDEPYGTVAEAISEIAELNTLEYDYTYVNEYKDSKEIPGINISIPFTEKSFVCSVPGTIKYGYDLSEIEEGDIKVNKAKKTITVNMPKMIVTKTIDLDSIEFYGIDKSIFNAFDPEESLDFQKAAQDYGLAKAKEKKLDHKVQVSTKKVIQSVFDTIPGYEDYTVKCNFK